MLGSYRRNVQGYTQQSKTKDNACSQSGHQEKNKEKSNGWTRGIWIESISMYFWCKVLPQITQNVGK